MEKVKSAFCEVCKTQRRFTKKAPNHTLHILVTIFTAGLWLIPYVIVAASAQWYFTCSECGSKLGKPDFGAQWRLGKEQAAELDQRIKDDPESVPVIGALERMNKRLDRWTAQQDEKRAETKRTRQEKAQARKDTGRIKGPVRKTWAEERKTWAEERKKSRMRKERQLAARAAKREAKKDRRSKRQAKSRREERKRLKQERNLEERGYR